MKLKAENRFLQAKFLNRRRTKFKQAKCQKNWVKNLKELVNSDWQTSLPIKVLITAVYNPRFKIGSIDYGQKNSAKAQSGLTFRFQLLQAIAHVRGGNGRIHGNITFSQNDGGTVTIWGKVVGLPPGRHGFHIHETGDVTSSCSSTGAHYNPFKKNHGALVDPERHVGDLGNIIASPDGVALISITDNVISLTGPYTILARSVVVHADADDFGKGVFPDSSKTGHAGPRIACGVIGLFTQEEPISTRRQKVIKFIKDSKEQQKWFREFGETQIFDLNEKEELTNFVKSCLQAIAEKNLLNLTEILHNDEVAFYDYMQDAFEEAATKIGDKIIQESKNTTHIECSAILVPFFDFECEKETSTVAFKVCKSGYPAFFISSNCDIFQTWDKYLDDAVTNEALICVPRDGYYTEDNPVVDFFQCNWNNASHSQSTQLENISKITSDPVFQKL
ncbi:hypothetical protein RUM44_008561 [Polyplax serrata]|uniref:Superoxide dismutase [Cu-Zn] n=1 Tax=Polyplax serrata TaxID=468196 RepID=A0ABR1B8M1_POLSC